MTKGQHTPGPWTHEIHDRGPDEELTVYIGPREDDGTMTHTIFEGAWTGRPEDGDPEADARLMGAAEQMRDYLETLAECLAGVLYAVYGPGRTPIDLVVRDAAAEFQSFLRLQYPSLIDARDLLEYVQTGQHPNARLEDE